MKEQRHNPILGRWVLPLLIFLTLTAGTAGAGNDQKELYQHETLENGLELFMIPSDRVPLVKIQITFRCGALTQSPETAGLFHLYEHMLFKGNRTYPDQSAFKAALKNLGVGTWNGGTSTEYVTYYFTLPAEKAAAGIRFWAEAVRYPLLDAEELEAEKEVVINEIRGYHDNRDHIYESALMNRLFYRFPWRRDVAGPEKNIRTADAEAMRKIQKIFYRPDKAALFISGDFHPAAIRRTVEDALGDWEPAARQAGESAGVAAQEEPHPLMEESANLYYGDPGYYPGITQTRITMRGPDVGRDPSSTYAADVLLMLLQNPESPFREALYRQVPGLYSKEYIWASYLTQRDGGEISFGTYMTAMADNSVFERSLLFEKVLWAELEKIASDPGYFSAEEFDLVKQKLADGHILDAADASSLAAQLSFWWASADTEYYRSYRTNLEKVTPRDITDYLKDYILGKPRLLSLRLNPQQISREALPEGFTEITRDNTYWWEEDK